MGWPKGKPRSEETKRRISKARAGQKLRPQSEETLRKRKATMNERYPGGYRYSEKAIQKRKRTMEEKYPEGYKHSEKTRRKISAALKGKPHYKIKGPNHPNWTGGQFLSDGYVFIYKPAHPYAKGNYVKRCVLVMEEILGQFLLPEEIVHHEGEKNDDRPEMLILFPSHQKHMAYHGALRRAKSWALI